MMCTSKKDPLLLCIMSSQYALINNGMYLIFFWTRDLIVYKLNMFSPV